MIKFPKNISAAVFDMDGVLLDTETISWRTWVMAAKDFCIQNIEMAKPRCMGANYNDTQEILKTIYGRDFDSKAFVDHTRELFAQIENSEGIALMKGAKETLIFLKGRYTLALATSTRKSSASRQLKNAGLIDYFDYTIYGDEITHSKPAPDIYKSIANKMNIPCKNCIVFEDSFNGVKSAHAAGMPVIMVIDQVQPTNEIRKLCYKVVDSLFEVINK